MVSTERMTGGRAFARQLASEGVQHVFGLPGDQTMHALDGLYDEPSIQFVTTRHDQGTTYPSHGYARGARRGRAGPARPGPGPGRGARARGRPPPADRGRRGGVAR